MNGLAESQLVTFPVDDGVARPRVPLAYGVISFEALGAGQGSVRALIQSRGVDVVIASPVKGDR